MCPTDGSDDTPDDQSATDTPYSTINISPLVDLTDGQTPGEQSQMQDDQLAVITHSLAEARQLRARLESTLPPRQPPSDDVDALHATQRLQALQTQNRLAVVQSRLRNSIETYMVDRLSETATAPLHHDVVTELVGDWDSVVEVATDTDDIIAVEVQTTAAGNDVRHTLVEYGYQLVEFTDPQTPNGALRLTFGYMHADDTLADTYAWTTLRGLLQSGLSPVQALDYFGSVLARTGPDCSPQDQSDHWCTARDATRDDIIQNVTAARDALNGQRGLATWLEREGHHREGRLPEAFRPD